jgi:hypothetical protein
VNPVESIAVIGIGSTIGIEQFDRLSEDETKVQRFNPLEKFLESRKMGDLCKIQNPLNSFHIPDIFNELPVMLVPIVFEKDKDEKLVLGVDLLREFAGIR